MSYEAISWAMAQPVSKSSAKFVLVAMADCVNGKADDMLCFASVKHLSDVTAQDRKTVMDGIQRLRDAGFIEDTGERRGQTGQVPVYRLKTPENGTVKVISLALKVTQKTPDNSTENGAGPENGTVPFFPPNSTVFPSKQYRFPAVTVPKTGHGTRKEPVINQEGTRNKTSAAALSIPGIESALMADYLAVRKAKNAGPITATVIAGLEREAGRAGLTLAEAVTYCCESGWQGFKATWYAKATGATVQAGFGHQPLNKQEALEQRNQRVVDEWANSGVIDAAS